jgi:hypothetical protein
MKYRLSPDLYPPIFEEVSQMRDLYSLSTVSRGAQAEAERLMYRHLVAEDFSSMVVLLRRINLSFPGSYHTLNVSMLLAPVSHSKGIRGRVMLAFNRLFSQTLAKLTHLKILVIHMWELKPRSCKGLLQHCTFKLNLFYSWFFVDDHLSSFLEKQSELRTLFLPKQVSRSFRLSDTALPKLRALGMDKGAKAALSIIRNRPVAYLRVGGYDHGDTEIWSGLRASKSPIRGLVIPQVNVESLKLLAEVCPNLQAFYNINFRVVPVSFRSSLPYGAPRLMATTISAKRLVRIFPPLPPSHHSRILHRRAHQHGPHPQASQGCVSENRPCLRADL